MADVAKRYQNGSPDLVRRLIARPARLDQRTRVRLAPQAALESVAQEDEEIARLQAELAVTQAVVRAQRREVESLRAQRRLLTESAADEDVRSTRARWADLVDSLLIRAR